MSKCRALNGYHRVVPCRAGSAVTLEPAPPTQKQIPARQGICASLLVASTKKRLGRSADPARCISEAFLDGPLSTTQRTTSQKLSGPIHATPPGTVRLANQPPEQGPMPPANRKGARLGLGRARRERKWGGCGRPVFWPLQLRDLVGCRHRHHVLPYALGVVYLGCQGIEACVVRQVRRGWHTADHHRHHRHRHHSQRANEREEWSV